MLPKIPIPLFLVFADQAQQQQQQQRQQRQQQRQQQRHRQNGSDLRVLMHTSQETAKAALEAKEHWQF